MTTMPGSLLLGLGWLATATACNSSDPRSPASRGDEPTGSSRAQVQTPANGLSGTSQDPRAPASCSDLIARARAMLRAVADSVEQCKAATDCQPVNYGSFDCVDCFPIFGGNAVDVAISRKAGEVKLICDSFKSAGCVLYPSGCPGGPASSEFACEQGRCVVPSP